MVKKRVLVIENSQTFADILLEFLDKEGYESLWVKNGLEGLKSFFSFLPELIITDINMPVLGGYQAARFLKSRSMTCNIPIIIFSLHEESSYKFRSKLAGADVYIGKSLENFEELANQVKKLLDEKRRIDYKLIEREGKKITDDSLVEMVNSLLENKLFQTTLVGMLAELSEKQNSLDETVKDIFALLANSCHAEISSIMIKDSDDCLLVYNANNAGYTNEIADDFKAITIADFNDRYSDYKVITNEVKDFFPAGENGSRIESYILVPLLNEGDEFATVHIGTCIKEYFSPVVLENINVFLSAAAPVIANALRLRQMENMQKKTRIAFARYVPVDVMDEIIKKSAAPVSQSENRMVAVLFSDIRSFTKISENTPARELVNFLNVYFSAMGNQIILEGGNIDKFIGDAIMAIFGAPKTLENASSSAVRAALRMVRALESLDTSDIVLPETGFGTGIGVNYGECVVGNIGFQNKLDYTVIGDTVNLASRVEGVTKYYQQPVIVTEYVYAAAKDDFVFRKADSVRVKGKDHPVGLYTVYEAFEDEAENETPLSLVISRDTLDQYNKGLKLFGMREWETAKQYFKKALSIAEKENKGDYLSSMYLSRIEEFQNNPPPPDWDGTITMTDK
ncbi:MAG: adenylate/guanylate cyclase domain-containing response regulator [Treponema sp.]|nr:adenylate/guanylate cyclase domain-containing response regulator [Treponema sp.]